jgi:hypothetical protein
MIAALVAGSRCLKQRICLEVSNPFMFGHVLMALVSDCYVDFGTLGLGQIIAVTVRALSSGRVAHGLYLNAFSLVCPRVLALA